jgi:hypothetical protein
MRLPGQPHVGIEGRSKQFCAGQVPCGVSAGEHAAATRRRRTLPGSAHQIELTACAVGFSAPLSAVRQANRASSRADTSSIEEGCSMPSLATDHLQAEGGAKRAGGRKASACR